MHVKVMLAELCRICWLNHETKHQLRAKTINFNVIEVLCARCHHRLTKCKLISKSYWQQVYILFTFSAILILLQCVIKPPPGRCNYLQCGNMYQCGCWRSVVILGGGNRRTRGKPPTLDGRPLPCHMPTPGFDPGSQRWQ